MFLKKSLIVGLLVLILSGCGLKYNVCPLKCVKKEKADFCEEQQNIAVLVHKLSTKEIKKYFNNRASQRIHPIVVSVKNNSDKPVYLDVDHVYLDVLSFKEVYASLRRSHFKSTLLILGTLGCVAFGGPLILFCGGLLGATAGLGGALGLAVTLAAVEVGTFTLLVKGSLDIAQNTQFNSHLNKDIKEKVRNKIVIEPQKQQTTLLCVRELPESFTLTLLKGEEKVPFAINLKNNAEVRSSK